MSNFLQIYGHLKEFDESLKHQFCLLPVLSTDDQPVTFDQHSVGLGEFLERFLQLAEQSCLVLGILDDGNYKLMRRGILFLQKDKSYFSKV